MIHGTLEAINQHKRLSEKLCEPCRLLRNQRSRECKRRGNLCPKGHERVRQAGSKRLCVECYQFDPSKCGTVAGRGQHERHGIPLCEPCKKSRREETWKRKGRKTHCKCGQEYALDTLGRGYCQICRRAVLAANRQPKWLDEYRSLKSLAYTDREIARSLAVRLEYLQKYT